MHETHLTTSLNDFSGFQIVEGFKIHSLINDRNKTGLLGSKKRLAPHYILKTSGPGIGTYVLTIPFLSLRTFFEES